MQPYHIYSSELSELAALPNPNRQDHNNGSSLRISKYHDRLGSFETNSFLFPHMLVMNMDWQIKEDMVILENDPSESISINFQLTGNLLSHFCNIRTLPVAGNTHNLLFSTPEKHTHHIHRNQQLNMLHISLNAGYFRQLIGMEDNWSESILTKLEKAQPFLGSPATANISAPMLQLIRSIQHNNWQGPVRNLQVQSKLFELLALQLQQFRQDSAGVPGFKKADIEKLHYLRLYIQEHFLEELSLFQLARITMLNEFKLKKGFKSLFNTTIFDYVKQLRMEHAGRLLNEQKKTIEEVAWELGYEHAHHFSASFKKHFGVSPSKWK